MTGSQPPFPGYQPGPAAYPPPGPGPTPDPAPKRANPLTSRPVIGAAALLLGAALGAGAAGGSGEAAIPAAAPTVTVTATTTASPSPTPSESAEPEPEPTAEVEPEPEPEPAEKASPTTFKWGKKGSFVYEDIEITLKVAKPKASANMFDKDNLETKLTVCNKGDDTIQELSAQGLGLYAEDKSGGQYSLYGPYRAPEFPVYTWQSSTLKPGKCRTGWVSFEDGRKAVRIATDIGDETYSWSKSGK